MEQSATHIENVESYHNMIWSVVHRKIRSHGIRPEYIKEVQEELFSEGGVIYLHSKNTFKEDKGAVFSTWLYTQLDGRLGNHIKRKLAHMTPYGSQRFESINDLDENLLFIQADDYLDVIPEAKEKVIQDLYEQAFNKWKVEKCAYLFFVYAFDETGNYNLKLKDFIQEEFDFLINMGVNPHDMRAASDDQVAIEYIKNSVEDYFQKDVVNKRKISNNVRKTIDYYLSTRRKECLN